MRCRQQRLCSLRHRSAADTSRGGQSLASGNEDGPTRVCILLAAVYRSPFLPYGISFPQSAGFFCAAVML